MARRKKDATEAAERGLHREFVPMTEHDVDVAIASGKTAVDLLVEACPDVVDRFYKIDTQLANLLTIVRVHFPDAEYYTDGSDLIHLMLGATHTRDIRAKPKQQRAALCMIKSRVGGGDW